MRDSAVIEYIFCISEAPSSSPNTTKNSFFKSSDINQSKHIMILIELGLIKSV